MKSDCVPADLKTREGLLAIQFTLSRCSSRIMVPEAHCELLRWSLINLFSHTLWYSVVAQKVCLMTDMVSSKSISKRWCHIHSHSISCLVPCASSILHVASLNIFCCAVCRLVAFTTDLVANILYEYFRLFLLRLCVTRINVAYSYYEPSWSSILLFTLNNQNKFNLTALFSCSDNELLCILPVWDSFICTESYSWNIFLD